MLMLTRKCREILVVTGADGCNIVVKVVVLEIEKGKVRLGFEAAGDVPIERFEVWERLRQTAHVDARKDERFDEAIV